MDSALPRVPTTFAQRAVRFFFMHLGGLVAIIVYFNLCERAGWSADGVRHALLFALIVKTCYAALAYSQGEHKHFDVSLWLMFALGTAGTYAGIEPVLWLFQHYSPAILFTTLGLTAIVPQLLGREPFTAYFAARTVPRWQHDLPATSQIGHVIAIYWTVLFFICAALAWWAPTDRRFTFVWPNLLIVFVGLTAQLWIPALYLRLFPPGLPRSVEPLLMGMPFAFNRKAARGANASIQFCVSGAEAGNYFLRIARGRCESFAGTAPAPDLTVYTPDTVWLRIAHGELDGTSALAQGLYQVRGDYSLLAKMEAWFGPRR